MAESMEVDTTESPTLRLDLTCSMCFAIYCDPVLLPCSHSFCRACLEANRRFTKKCPLCRTQVKPGQEVTNLALKNACETYVRFADPTLTETTTPEDTCKMHRKPLTLYCVKDEEPICVDCVSLHTTHEHTHKLLGIQEGANVAKVGGKKRVKLGFSSSLIHSLYSTFRVFAGILRSLRPWPELSYSYSYPYSLVYLHNYTNRR